MTKVKTKTSFFIKTLAIYLFLSPFDFLPIIEGFSLSKILIIIPIVGFLFEIGSFGNLKKSSFYTLLYLSAAFITLFWTIDFDSSLNRVISLVLNIGVIILFSSRNYTKEELNVLFKALALSGWLLFAICVIFADFEVMLGRLTVVINGAYQDPNYLCGFFIFPICYYLNEFISKKKVFGIISIIAFFAIILLTGSRGGTLAVLLSVFVLFYKLVANSRKTLVTIVVALLVVSAAVYFAWDYLPEAITVRFSPEFNEEDQGSNRLVIWQSLWDHFKDSNLFRQLFGNGVATVAHYAAFQQVAHNILLEALVEMGVLGFFLIFTMYFYYGVKAFKSALLFAPFLGYMAMCMTLSLYSYKPIWNIILLIVIENAYLTIEKSHEEADEVRVNLKRR